MGLLATIIANSDTILAVGGAVLSAIGSAAAVIWKAGRWHAADEAANKRRDDAIVTIAAQVRGIAGSVDLLTRDVAELKTVRRVAERDQAKLEGKLDQTNQSLVQTIAGLQQVSGSLNAIWRTLQVLHPEQVPRRAGDKGKDG